ncbi:MAG: hypothetical protein HFG20_00955 [Anaerotruncus sp.]|nr:hypothetical protein [Anaerotruncus sp.]
MEEITDDEILYHLTNQRMGTVAVLQRHIRADVEVVVHHPQIDFSDVGAVVAGERPPHMRTHIGVNRGQVLNRISTQIDIILLVFILCRMHAFFIIDEAIHKRAGRGRPQPQPVRAEIDGIENSLDTGFVKAVSCFIA